MTIWLLMAGILAARAAEKTLLDVRPGAVIRTTQSVDVAVPEMLKGLLQSGLPLAISGGHVVPLFMANGLQGAAGCLSRERTLEFKDAPTFKLPKGSEFVLRKVAAENAPSPFFAGPATRVEVEAKGSVGMRLQGKFLCYPGKTGKGAISLEAFEGVFAHKIIVIQGEAGQK